MLQMFVYPEKFLAPNTDLPVVLSFRIEENKLRSHFHSKERRYGAQLMHGASASPA
jgi:hypothetical protein